MVVAGGVLEPRRELACADRPELRVHGDQMVPPGTEDFAVNVEASGPPAWLRAELEGALATAGRYPDERVARASIAARHGRAPEEVVLTNGASEAFWAIAAALRPRHAVCIHPAFTEAEVALRAFGHPVERVPRRLADFALDAAALPGAADLIALDNPNNPSGTLACAFEIAALCRPGRVVLVDEAFMDFVPGEHESLADRRDLPGLIVVRSLTKLWSLAGVRAGYLLAPPTVATAIRDMRPPWSVNALALAALRACAERVAEGRAIAERVAAERAELARALARLPGVRAWPSAANFLLLHVPDGSAVRGRLLDRGIAVRPAHTFPYLGPDHLRVAVRDPAANARLVDALADALG
jgi:histidinol-phosphate aminotransferase